MPNASDYEFSAFEDAFASLITAASIDCATQRDTDDLTTPRAEVKFTLGDSDTISGDSTDGFYRRIQRDGRRCDCNYARR